MIVFDSSAYLALARQEKGYEKIVPYAGLGVMSSVNVAEIYTRQALRGLLQADVCADLHDVVPTIYGFSANDAAMLSAFVKDTRLYGLSLGDCACLALGKKLELPVITADHVWARLDIGVEVRVVG